MATNVLFKVKQVPAFYTPYFMYPIQSDQRSTGFLFPHFGYSQLRGFNVGRGLLLGHGPQLRPDLLRRPLLEVRPRVRPRVPLRARPALQRELQDLRLPPEGRRPPGTTTSTGTPSRCCPYKLRGTLHVRQYSDLAFQEQIQDSLEPGLQPHAPHRRSTCSRGFGTVGFQALADSTETFFAEDSAVNEHLPTVRLNQSPRKIGRSGVVFTWEARGRAPGDRRPGPRGPLRAVRPLPARLPPALPELPPGDPGGPAPLHPLRGQRRRGRHHAAPPSTAATRRPAWRCAVPPSRASSTRRGTSTPTSSST